MKRKVLLTENMTLELAFEHFQEFNRAKNLSDSTIRYYEDCFKYFRSVL